jgi:hypothetical protein
VYQTRKAAHRWWLIVQGRMAEATGRDPDAYACCSGDMCGCGGKTNADLWAETAERIPPLKLARIEVRNVGPWDMLEEGADHAW